MKYDQLKIKVALANALTKLNTQIKIHNEQEQVILNKIGLQLISNILEELGMKK